MADHSLDLDEVRSKLKGHSIFAPSASARWMTCPGSLIPNLLAGDTAGYDAAYGTVGHSVAEEWLSSGREPRHLVGKVVEVDEGHKVFEVEIDLLMLSHVRRYVEWVKALGGDHYVERRVDFSAYTPLENQGGTADFLSLEYGVCRLRDLKLGINVQVFAERNSQLLLYALGAFLEFDWLYDFQTIDIGIGQPRLDHWDTWSCTREELLEFADQVRDKAEIAWSGTGYRQVSEKGCQWCKVSADCPAMLKHMEQLTDGAFDDLGGALSSKEMSVIASDGSPKVGKLPAAQTLTLEQQQAVLKYRKPFETWFKRIEENLEAALCAGVKVPGMKLVEGRANRVFRDAESAFGVLDFYGVEEREFYSKKAKTPKQVETILRNKGYSRAEVTSLFSEIVYKPEGKPTAVASTDKRPSLELAFDSAFSDISPDDDDGL